MEQTSLIGLSCSISRPSESKVQTAFLYINRRTGLEDEYIVLRVTGCPNGCGRAMLA
ncbi:hypothetical protein NEIFL0001_1309 [Neisseria flavescens SK114]|nr:hypothetical protein NEIFL0001_1309 [Neisseria flavescens SK114]